MSKILLKSYYIEIIKDSQEENEGQETPNIEFNDVDNSHWAYSEIQDFVKQGHIDGYGDGTFRPENNIKRNEFVKIFNAVHLFSDSSWSIMLIHIMPILNQFCF